MGPAARSEGPKAEILATVRPLGPGRSWAGLGPVGSVAGDPDRHRDWLLCPSSVPAAAGRGLKPRAFPVHRPVPQLQVQDSVMGRHPFFLWQGVFRPAQASFSPFSQSDQILCRFRLVLQRKSGPWIALPAHRLYYGWMPHNASFGFLDLTPSILLLRQFWD
jgi:hypothetical protein